MKMLEEYVRTLYDSHSDLTENDSEMSEQLQTLLIIHTAILW